MRQVGQRGRGTQRSKYLFGFSFQMTLILKKKKKNQNKLTYSIIMSEQSVESGNNFEQICLVQDELQFTGEYGLRSTGTRIYARIYMNVYLSILFLYLCTIIKQLLLLLPLLLFTSNYQCLYSLCCAILLTYIAFNLASYLYRLYSCHHYISLQYASQFFKCFTYTSSSSFMKQKI